jgi:hypothetical protein
MGEVAILKHIRLATQEEVESIRDTSNFPPEFAVFAMDQNPGHPDLAVVKHVVELDPVYFGQDTNDVQKAKFIWGLEERLIGAGVKQYHFSVRDSDERWKKVIASWGGKLLNEFPEARFLKELS